MCKGIHTIKCQACSIALGARHQSWIVVYNVRPHRPAIWTALRRMIHKHTFTMNQAQSHHLHTGTYTHSGQSDSATIHLMSQSCVRNGHQSGKLAIWSSFANCGAYPQQCKWIIATAHDCLGWIWPVAIAQSPGNTKKAQSRIAIWRTRKLVYSKKRGSKTDLHMHQMSLRCFGRAESCHQCSACKAKTEARYQSSIQQQSLHVACLACTVTNPGFHIQAWHRCVHKETLNNAG